MRQAARVFLKTPGFALAVVTTLALGIGASTAIFSLVNGILLEPLPLNDPARLVYISEFDANGGSMSVAWPSYLDWVARAHSVAALASTRDEALTLTGGDSATRIRARRVTANFLSVVGGRIAVGHDVSPGADRPNAAGEALVGDGFWRLRLGADPNVVGRMLVLDEVPYTIVGVLAPQFRYIRAYDAYLSMGPISGTAQLLNRGNHNGFSAVGRLQPGTTVDAAQHEFQTIAAALEREYPKTNAGVTARVQPLLDRVVSDIRVTLLALLGAVGVLLLIACVNVANLLIARGAARQHELSVRAALGASRIRLAVQLLTESTLLSAAGGALGVVAAIGLLRALVAVAPEGTPRIESVRLDSTALLFSVAAAAVCGIVFGLFPAAMAWRADARASLLRLRSSGASAGSHRLRRLLIVTETALAIVLLAGAALTGRTMQALTHVDAGFETDRLLTMRVMLAGDAWTPARRRTFFADITPRVRAVPGVSKAALAFSLPIDGSQWNSVFIAADKPEPVRADTPSAAISPVGAGYFDALGMRLVRGRVLDERDTDTSPLVVVVNESLARRIWPGEDAVGKHLKQGWFDSATPWMEVVGIVGDVKFDGLTEATPLQVYLPFTQQSPRSIAILVRTSADPATVTHAVERAVHDIDRNLPVFSVRTMDDVVNASIARQRMAVIIFVTFAGVALVLAAIGLYGVVSHSVTERTHEIGVRMALGAERRHVLALVVRQGLTMAVVGTAIGSAGAVVLSRTIQSLLYGVSATDPVTFLAVAAALLGVAAAACYLPAWRAARVDPTQALRAE
jgi:putative ABC transport system permease protein